MVSDPSIFFSRYDIDGDELDDEEWLDYTNTSQPKTCGKCKTTNLEWAIRGRHWILVSMDGSDHECPKFGGGILGRNRSKNR